MRRNSQLCTWEVSGGHSPDQAWTGYKCGSLGIRFHLRAWLGHVTITSLDKAGNPTIPAHSSSSTVHILNHVEATTICRGDSPLCAESPWFKGPDPARTAWRWQRWQRCVSGDSFDPKNLRRWRCVKTAAENGHCRHYSTGTRWGVDIEGIGGFLGGYESWHVNACQCPSWYRNTIDHFPHGCCWYVNFWLLETVAVWTESPSFLL